MELGREFLPDLRGLTQRYGALLIFDEIVTGFRLGLGGAQEYFGVTPDLAVFAKGISNGMPLSAISGAAMSWRRLRMWSISSTFGGDALSLAAARATLEVYETEDVIGTLWARGRQLHEGFAAVAEGLGIPTRFQGVAPLGQLTFERPNSSPASTPSCCGAASFPIRSSTPISLTAKPTSRRRSRPFQVP